MVDCCVPLKVTIEEQVPLHLQQRNKLATGSYARVPVGVVGVFIISSRLLFFLLFVRIPASRQRDHSRQSSIWFATFTAPGYRSVWTSFCFLFLIDPFARSFVSPRKAFVFGDTACAIRSETVIFHFLIGEEIRRRENVWKKENRTIIRY